MSSDNAWRRCGSCKRPIELKSTYFACSITGCRGAAYCSVPCFDDHVAVMRHKDAWASERIAPTIADKAEQVQPMASAPAASMSGGDGDILVVASKLKDYIKKRSGLNTSATVLSRLSDMIRVQCDKAMERAKGDSRKTVMDRDFYL